MPEGPMPVEAELAIGSINHQQNVCSMQSWLVNRPSLFLFQLALSIT